MENLLLTQDGVAIRLIDSDEKLLKAAEQLKKSKELGLDLEFDQNRFTYGFNLCLVQLADENNNCYIIDPFLIKDLQPLFNLIEDPAITKIIHHSNNDILLLDKMGCSIKGVMDTDVAAKILNYEKSSLATVLKEEFNTEIDKSQQSSNWNKRPLTEDQLVYAAIDVIYLHRVKDKLVKEITALGRENWLEEENQLLEKLRYTEPENPHLKLRNAFRLNYFQQFILKELYQLRDTLARQFDKPSPYIIPNDALVELATEYNTNIHEWLNHTKGIHGGLKRPKNEQLLKDTIANAIQAAKAQHISNDYPISQYQRPIRTAETERRKEELTIIQKQLIEEYGEFATRLIMNQNLIVDYSQTGKLKCYKKYGYNIITAKAKALGINLAVQTINSNDRK
ncbi:ribonuclease D [Pontibacter vulgaris]|uniref:ribonuclease D n=1 Tax=Pontibacter vulgaris TaxID=2905679 RepID=UPI001FA7CC68|nr:HRDC domain-containing protein [Pontibacter vulgaris]